MDYESVPADLFTTPKAIESNGVLLLTVTIQNLVELNHMSSESVLGKFQLMC
jgi:hypothetical protein